MRARRSHKIANQESQIKNPCLLTNRIYFYSSKTLAVATRSLVLLPALLLEHHDFLIASVFDYGGGDPGTR
jgi:hypothetical protein